MAKKRKKKKSKRGNPQLREQVTSNSREQKSRGGSYGYLNIPRGIPLYQPEPGETESFDHIMYKVTTKNHPDRNKAGRAKKGSYWYKRPIKTHRGVGSENDTELCPTTIGKKCPICEYRAKQLASGATRESLDAIKPKFRTLYYVIPRGIKGKDEVPHLFDHSYWNYQILLDDEVDEREEFGVFPDTEEGYTVTVRWKKSSVGSGDPYAEATRIDFEERDPIDQDIIDGLPDLDTVLNIMDYDELEKKFLEYDEDEDESEEPADEEEDEEVDDDEEVDEEDEDEDEVEEELDDEDDEDDEDDDEDEEEEDSCIACEGSGKNSKGNTCRICKGTGVKPEPKEGPIEDDDDEDEEEEEERPRKKKKVKKSKKKKGKKSKKSKKKKKNKCPHGYKFGKDNDEYEECEDCNKWQACYEAS